MRLNKNVLIVFLLLSVFAVGTLHFVDTVEAAKWKKFDSGRYYIEGDPVKYTSYIQGKNKILVQSTFYGEPFEKITITKGKTNVKITFKHSDKKATSFSMKHNGKNVKNIYKTIVKSVYLVTYDV